MDNESISKLAKKYIRDIIKDEYKRPTCYRKQGCLYEASLIDFVCNKCLVWNTVQNIYEKVLNKGII